MIKVDSTIKVGAFELLDLAKDYKTPLYVYSKEKIIQNINEIKEAFLSSFPSGEILYASKACDFTELYRIVKSQGIGTDVVSIGEFYTALNAKMDPSKIYYHGNSKSDEELEYALKHHIGCIVIDNLEEVKKLKRFDIPQKVMVRLNPNVDAHIHEAVSTAVLDCKFGVSIFSKECDHLLEELLDSKLQLAGFHYHIGSQIQEADVFLKGIQEVLPFLKYVKEKYGIDCKELNIGGGFPAIYLKEDQKLNLKELFINIKEILDDYCLKHNLKQPKILIEPGRSIVADAGITLYKVNNVKEITGASNYVSIDGGMTDNPRFALYGSRYTAVCANKLNEAHDKLFHLAGHCCESGDLIAKDILLPSSICPDDIIAVFTTGAYNYSMASNYNRFTKPAVIMVDQDQVEVVIKRERLEDLLLWDL